RTSEFSRNGARCRHIVFWIPLSPRPECSGTAIWESVMLERYYKYHKVISRFRSGALGSEIDRIAADLSHVGYKHDSVKIYLSRTARFSTYAAKRGCRKSRRIPERIVEQLLRGWSTTATRWSVQVAIGHAARVCPDRFATRPSKEWDPNGLDLPR